MEDASKDDIVRFLLQSAAYKDNAEVWRWIDEIRAACMQMNYENYIEAMKEVMDMNDFDRETYERLCWTGRERQMIAAEKRGEARGEARGASKMATDLLAMAQNGVVTIQQITEYQKSLQKSC